MVGMTIDGIDHENWCNQSCDRAAADRPSGGVSFGSSEGLSAGWF